MRKEIELLENHPDLHSNSSDVGFPVIQFFAVDENPAGRMLLQPIDAPDEGRFSRTGRTADHYALTGTHGQTDV